MDKTSEYGKIYSEIKNGFSKELIEKQYIYFKHPSIAEYFSNYSNYEYLEKQGHNKGLLSEKEKIEEAIHGGWWSSEKESNINFFKKTVSNLIKTKSKLVLPSQKDEIDKQIKKNEAILATYAKERKEIVGYTLEEYANDKLTEQLLIFYTYSDAEFKCKLFKTTDDYYEMSESFIEKIRKSYFGYSYVFSNHNIKLVAATGFFQNLIYISNDAYNFWGKPVVDCTKYQTDLFLYGKMFRNYIKSSAENNKPISDEIVGDPEKLIQLIDSKQVGESKHVKTSQRNNKYTVSSHVGATSEDLNKMGVKVEKIGGKSLLQMAKEKGGTIEKHDYLSARENIN